ncbi:MAG: PLP-dependent aminotransferase family protein [Aestuariivirga sp.]
MTIWSPQLTPGVPRYQAIADALKTDLLRGVLKPGDRLPTHRDLAWRLGVTTGTVTRAYSEAEKLGLLSGEVGRGSFVKMPGALAQPFDMAPAVAGEENEILDLGQASPPHLDLARELDQALSVIMSSPSRLALLDYTPPEGHPLHRAMGAKWLARSGIVVDESQVVVTAGAHPALISCLADLSQHGERLFVEGLNYPTLKPIAKHLGLELVPLEMDAGGLVPEALERAARNGEARMLYVVPTLQNPTTASLSHERRQAIVDISRRYGITIVEDDIFRLLHPRLQPPTIYTMAPERTYHITSISKTLSPGLRVGFVTTPPGKIETLKRHQTVASGRAVGIAAEVARHWIEGDAAERVLNAIIAENAVRRQIALDAFAGRDFKCEMGAPFMWLKLPEHWRPGEFARTALDHGIRITRGSAFAIDRRADDHGVRICFGGAVTREKLRGAFSKLNVLLDDAPDESVHSVA